MKNAYNTADGVHKTCVVKRRGKFGITNHNWSAAPKEEGGTVHMLLQDWRETEREGV